jgi:hypothetical protein
MLPVVPLWLRRELIEVTHLWLCLGESPISPIAKYLPRSMSAVCAFYGVLLVALSSSDPVPSDSRHHAVYLRRGRGASARDA